jgi:hypothetical protein
MNSPSVKGSQFLTIRLLTLKDYMVALLESDLGFAINCCWAPTFDLSLQISLWVENQHHAYFYGEHFNDVPDYAFLARILRCCKLNNNTCISPWQSTQFPIHLENGKFCSSLEHSFSTILKQLFYHPHTQAHAHRCVLNNKILRAEHLLSFWLHWDHPQTHLCNAQQSNKSSLTANTYYISLVNSTYTDSQLRGR